MHTSAPFAGSTEKPCPRYSRSRPQTNIKELVARLPVAADVMTRFGLGCSGCGVSKYETIEQGARAHGLRSNRSSPRSTQRGTYRPRPARSPTRTARPARRAPGAFAGRAQIAHVVPVMSGKGGVGKSLVTALLAIGLRRKHIIAWAFSMPTSPGRRSPGSSGCTQPLIDRGRSGEDDAAGPAAAVDDAGDLAQRDRDRQFESADRPRGHGDDLARTDRRRA